MTVVVAVVAIFEDCKKSSFFRGCQTLRSVSFEVGSVLEEVGEYAFGGTGLTSIEFPSSVRRINSNAFRDSSDLQNVSFGSLNTSSMDHIGHAAFYRTGIKSVMIPRSVSSMGSHAFSYTSLESVTFEANGNKINKLV